MSTFTYATPTFITEIHCFCYLSIAAFNDCYSELMPYTALANTYWISFHDMYQCQGQAINDNSYSCYITAVELV